MECEWPKESTSDVAFKKMLFVLKQIQYVGCNAMPAWHTQLGTPRYNVTRGASVSAPNPLLRNKVTGRNGP